MTTKQVLKRLESKIQNKCISTNDICSKIADKYDGTINSRRDWHQLDKWEYDEQKNKNTAYYNSLKIVQKELELLEKRNQKR